MQFSVFKKKLHSLKVQYVPFLREPNHFFHDWECPLLIMCSNNVISSMFVFTNTEIIYILANFTNWIFKCSITILKALLPHPGLQEL